MVLWMNKGVRNLRKQFLNFEKKLGDEKMANIYYFVGVLIYFYPTVALKESRIDRQWYVFFFWRGVVGMIISHVLLNSQDLSPHIGDSYTFRLLFFRASLLGVFHVFLYYALPYMPLTDFYLLFNTLPIFFFILRFLVTREPLNKKELLGVLISIVGIIIAVYPELLGEPTFDATGILVQGKSKILLYLLYSLGVLIWAASVTNVKYAKGNKFSPYHVTYFMSTGFSIYSVLWHIYEGVPFAHGLEVGDILQLIIVFGVLNTISIYLQLRAFKIGDVGKLTLVGYFLVVLAFVLDYAKFDESFNRIKVLGSFITLLGILRIVF